MAGQRIGYVRVSTLDQNRQRQLDGLVLDRIFTDKASGRDTARPELAELLRFVRDGDTVLVHSMDRLARNLDDLRALVQRAVTGVPKSVLARDYGISRETVYQYLRQATLA